MNAREFEPVWLPDGSKVRDGRASATFLRAFNSCRRSAYLYETVRGPLSWAMDRGSALHAVQERARLAQIEQDERSIPPSVVKAIVDEVLAEYDVPLEEHDYVREMAFRWADEWECDPQRLVAVERLFELEVGGFVVRCKVDCAMLSEDGSTLEIVDTKSSRSMPSMEDVARKRPDGTYMAKNMQLVLYALALVFGVQVRFDVDMATGERVEVREPFPLAPRAQVVHARFEYPGIVESRGPREGLIARREMSLTPLELHQYLGSLEAMGERVRHAVDTGDWPARPSASGCAECAAPLLCPIAPDLRTFVDSGDLGVSGFVNSPEDASKRAAWLDRTKAMVAALEKELKQWSKANDGCSIPFGDDLEFGWAVTSSEEIKDREGMFRAVEEAVQFGAPFDRSRYVKSKTGTRWTRRVRDKEGSDA